jgi:acetylglutamate kinase
MSDPTDKPAVLIEALAYLRKHRNRVTVIKLGGSVLEHGDALSSILTDVVFMETAGMRPVLVHGGGKAIDRAMAAAGLEPRKIHGRRITDSATLALVLEVLIQQINREIVEAIQAVGGQARAVHSSERQCLLGEVLRLKDTDGRLIDLGRAGHVTRVEPEPIQECWRAGEVPVIPSLALDADNKWLNVNADTAAAAVASALGAERFVLVTDTPGVLRNPDTPQSRLAALDSNECQELIAQGIIRHGMVPKVEACLQALREGVARAQIVDGRASHCLLGEVFADNHFCTEIRLAKEHSMMTAGAASVH